MRNRDREVVVTGTGVCCHMGDDWASIESALREGRPTPFATWAPAVEHDTQCQLVGIYPNDLTLDLLGIEKHQARFMGRAALLGLRATRLALGQAQIPTRDLAVIVGSGTGDVATHREVASKLARERGARRVSPTVIPRLMASTVPANLATVLEATGPSFTAAAACAGGAYNLLLAAQLIELGHVDAAIAGGVEVADVHFHVGFDAMRAYTSTDNDRPDRASRPYAADRAGFIFSEGAGVLVLETRAGAEARGADILGTLKGCGMSSDGTGNMVAPAVEGAELAMRRALDHAGVSPDEIDYVNTHGTSTPVGDISEVRAIRKVFGGRPVAYSSTKGYTGHPVSAAGAIEAVFTLAMLRGGWIAPCVNVEAVDPELEDYPPVLEPLSRGLSLALSNSFGFGGTNATLVLGRA
ncbi:MAG: beta-ketoacyl-[acyl-carrier-protein] synthase family protein [Acidobacteria bacterium]|nr:beta-ketoacyl-[acyl-carrier-protein] synthase family protein [Acidobacteriota bacterium]